MSTSNSYNFSLNRDAIITKAFQMINVYDLVTIPSSDDITYASIILNMMVKTWQAEGIKLWKRKLGTLFPSIGQSCYQLGSVSGADNATLTYVSTTLFSNATNGASSLSLITAAGISANDFIGIQLDNGTRQWSIVSGSPVSSTVTITDTLSSSASAGNSIITYTSKINRPLEILRSNTLDLFNSNTESQMSKISYDEYFDTPVKSISGRPNNFYYDRLINNAISYTGALYLFPTPSTVTDIIVFTYYDGIQDFDNSTDDADFPQEWYYAIVVNLAVELAYAYGKYPELDKLEPKAMLLKETLKSFDTDDEPLVFKMRR